jgi:predicted nucleotidyltransferase
MVAAAITTHQAEIEELCKRFGVRTLYVFGSAVRDALTDESDLDFLVEFDNPVVPGYADRYFGLSESLEDLFRRPVDLVVERAIRNPYFRESVEESRVLLYAA